MSTGIGLTPDGSSTVHIYTQTIHRTAQLTTNLKECVPCPVFASFTLTFAIQLRKKHGKTSIRVAEEYTHTHTHTHITNNIKPPQYKLKLPQYKIHTNEIVAIQSNTLSIRSPYRTLHFYPQELHRNSLHFTSLHFTSLHFETKSLHINHVSSPHITTLHITSLLYTHPPLEFLCL
jgi:hypothetical protein